MIKTALKWGLLAYVAFTFGTIAWQEVQTKEAQEVMHWSQGNYLVMTYFHGTKRCTTCNSMEIFSHDALAKNFSSYLTAGKLKMRVLNWQDPVNAIFAKKYKLLGNTVILSEIRDGKELRYKNLADVWFVSSDKNEFMDYIRTEVKPWMEGI